MGGKALRQPGATEYVAAAPVATALIVVCNLILTLAAAGKLK